MTGLEIVVLTLLFVAVAYWLLSEGSDRNVEGRRAPPAVEPVIPPGGGIIAINVPALDPRTPVMQTVTRDTSYLYQPTSISLPTAADYALGAGNARLY